MTLKVNTRWTQKLNLISSADGHEVQMDANKPIGEYSAMTPKQLVVAGLSGCTGMDVIALLKKFRQPLQAFEIEAEVEKSHAGHPEVFTKATLYFRLKGALDPEKVIEAVTLSQTRYCGVSAMLAKAFPIYFQIELNGSPIGKQGQAFSEGS